MPNAAPKGGTRAMEREGEIVCTTKHNRKTNSALHNRRALKLKMRLCGARARGHGSESEKSIKAIFGTEAK